MIQIFQTKDSAQKLYFIHNKIIKTTKFQIKQSVKYTTPEAIRRTNLEDNQLFIINYKHK